MNPEVSVVIPCFNEVRYIENCVLSLLSNGFSKEKMEVLVVDGGSQDGTLPLLHELSLKYPQVKIFSNPKRITPVSLNVGIFAATGNYILISGAHAAFEQGYIGRLLEALERNPEAIAVGGIMETKVKNSKAVSESIRTVLMHPLGVGNSKFRTGVDKMTSVDTVPFGLYRAPMLKSSGGYDERLIRNHDMELSKRLLAQGGKIYLLPEAKCTYFARESLGAMAKNNFKNGKWNLKTVWITRTFTSLGLRHFIPLLFLGSWSLPLLLALADARWVFAALGIIIFYQTVLAVFAWKARNGINRWFWMLAAFNVLHFSYGFGSFMGLLSLPFTSRKP
ncbi:MAG: glycosyltransferase family 2 protein [Bacteroidetes bacterium]|nr:glycosyltransferase family 2 protein [Bacteroidota bacterium]MBM3425273.1 glycosyltransferase family 2 protein [Bacteroidota bacterium]